MKAKSLIGGAVLIIMLGFGLAGGAAIALTTDRDAVERGKYLVTIAGCNDCHTSGYMATDGKVPETEWLSGDSFGWRGPWGTTYAPNLRDLVQDLSAEQWVVLAKNLRARPPMPWFNLNQMDEADLRAIYDYLRYLGPNGNHVPAYVPPGQEPATPFALFPPPPA